MDCNICPRNCNADRVSATGFCGAPAQAVVSKHMLHMWEEPLISGTNGSGAVFFAGCNLRCVFCQNYHISQNCLGDPLSTVQLARVFLELQSLGAHNINLVSPTPYLMQIVKSLRLAKKEGLAIPILYNSNAYENTSALKNLEGLIDIYLPDLKYYESQPAHKYSGARDYFEYASKAVLEMHRQVGNPVLGQNGILRRGLLIRHLVLPGQRKDSMRLLDWINASIPEAWVSLMAQYVPMHRAAEYKELNRRLTAFEYDSVVEYCRKIGVTNGFAQHRSAAITDYTPDFGANR